MDEFATVLFNCSYMTIMVTVERDPDKEDDYSIGVANDLIEREYGFSPMKLAFNTEVEY